MIAVLVVLVSSYIGFCVLFYFFQHLLFFRPEILSPSFKYNYSFPFEELEFEMEDGGSINGIYILQFPRREGWFSI